MKGAIPQENGVWPEFSGEKHALRQKTGAGTLKHKAKGSFASIVTLDNKNVQRLLRDTPHNRRRGPGSHQARLSKAGHGAPSRPQPWGHGRPRRGSGRSTRPMRSCATPAPEPATTYKRSGSGYAGGAPFGGGGVEPPPRGAWLDAPWARTCAWICFSPVTEARRGLDLELEIPVRRDCRYCRGAGAIDLGHVRVCGKCHGRGRDHLHPG